MVRVRFAPSPTGFLHVGGARTALYNWLFARHHGGSFILRIEDTDRTRYVPEALEDIKEGLRWLGLDWDEGPDVGGPHGPYFQSQRTELYRKKALELVEKGAAYPCFCTAERLAELRALQRATGQRTGYDRRCRNLTPEEREEKLRRGEPHVIRLKVPLDGTTEFTDRLRGKIVYENRELEDIILLKSDGFPTYHLANVVDDHEMGITHVMRADEWIPSTPYHVILYRAFGWDPPEFAHLPVILSPDGKGKLSKRHGATSVREFQKAGYLPDALVNFLALLGWSPGDDREILTREELIELFDLDRVGTRPVHFDYKKLEWMNGEYIRKTPDAQLLEEVRKRVQAHGLAANEEDLQRMIPLLKERVRTLEQFIEYGIYFFRDPETYDPKGVRKHFQPPEEVIPRLEALKSRWEALPEWTETALEHSLRELAEELQVKAGKLIHPVRLSLTGFTVGPSLFALVEALGRERTLRRLETAVQRLREGRVEVHNAS